MKFEEIILALREGKKVRRKCWCAENYIILEEKGDIITDLQRRYILNRSDLNADDWEVVKEPKKVKLRDLTEEQFTKWMQKHCKKYDEGCNGCPFKKVLCSWFPNIDDWWIRNKDVYSDEFLDQTIEVEIEVDENNGKN